MRFVTEHFVHIFGKRGIALFYRFEKLESVELDIQVEALKGKTHGDVPESVAARLEGDGARAEVGNLNGGSVHAEAAYRGENAVDKRLIYGDVKAVVIFTLSDVHPI